MRRLEFDAEEFPAPAAEEHLTLALEKKGRGGDLHGFLVKCMGVEAVRKLPPGSLAFVAAYPRADDVLGHLRTFAGLPEAELRSASFAVLQDDDLAREIAVETSSWFVLYHWMTAA